MPVVQSVKIRTAGLRPLDDQAFASTPPCVSVVTLVSICARRSLRWPAVQCLRRHAARRVLPLVRTHDADTCAQPRAGDGNNLRHCEHTAEGCYCPNRAGAGRRLFAFLRGLAAAKRRWQRQDAPPQTVMPATQRVSASAEPSLRARMGRFPAADADGARAVERAGLTARQITSARAQARLRPPRGVAAQCLYAADRQWSSVSSAPPAVSSVTMHRPRSSLLSAPCSARKARYL